MFELLLSFLTSLLVFNIIQSSYQSIKEAKSLKEEVKYRENLLREAIIKNEKSMVGLSESYVELIMLLRKTRKRDIN